MSLPKQVWIFEILYILNFDLFYIHRGVVQLFNAVRKQQKVLDEKIKEAGSSELKREKVEKSMTKDKFLDILKSADSKPEKVTKIYRCLLI